MLWQEYQFLFSVDIFVLNNAIKNSFAVQICWVDMLLE